MADTKLSALTALTGANVDAAVDILYIDDVSVTTGKKILIDELGIALNATQAEVDAGTDTKGLIASLVNKVSLLATQATTSGTTKDFTFPAGTRQITMEFVGVSKSGTSNILIQLGDAGGIEATGYLGASSAVTISTTNYTTGFGLDMAVATYVVHGTVTLTLVDSATFTWVASGTLGQSDIGVAIVTAGSKSLSAELTTVRVTMVNGTDTFDAGLIGASYIR